MNHRATGFTQHGLKIKNVGNVRDLNPHVLCFLTFRTWDIVNKLETISALTLR
jgi:hypothetical protein